MLVPITRKTFEELVPPFTTAAQYRYCWGGLTDVVRRLLFSLVGVLVAVAVELMVSEAIGFFVFIVGAIAAIYWLWAPIVVSAQRNRTLRRYSFAGLYQGEVLDRYVTEETVSTRERVDKTGKLVIEKDRQPILHLEIGDRQGFLTEVQVPFQRRYRSIRRGDMVELLAASNRADLSRIGMLSDVYIPDHKLWVGDYPYLRRDLFVDVSQQVQIAARRDRWAEPDPAAYPPDRREPRDRLPEPDVAPPARLEAPRPSRRPRPAPSDRRPLPPDDRSRRDQRRPDW